MLGCIFLWAPMVSVYRSFCRYGCSRHNHLSRREIDFFDLDFSGTKNGRGNEFKEHLWWENIWIFRILRKYWEGCTIRRFSFFSGFHFSAMEFPPIFTIAYKISKIHPTVSPQSWKIGNLVKNGIFLIFSETLRILKKFQFHQIPWTISSV